ncbi:MAG TPA: hypothetical protein VGK99_03695 [Acidobacteriota bacterium]|jgi:hypothetical protein
MKTHSTFRISHSTFRIPHSAIGILVLVVLATQASAQVYSPKVLVKGQVDTTDPKALAAAIYAQSGAVTPREKAEAIWRFFLTDGRFVAPGFWYHIAGWAYEEPVGEVLDPIKLLNSYGFGLCYHIAPLLEAVWEAGGFSDARVWFLTGHTVAEVFYDGAYHYFDSDLLGFNTVGTGDPKKLAVASVRQVEADGDIILGKLIAPNKSDASRVVYPWYPADVKGSEMNGLVELFTSTQDNWLFPFTRYAAGHRMDFVLRPGERLTRFFHPENSSLFYLPYKRTEKGWEEFPEEVAHYRIRTPDGPRSQKDNRYWATGKLEYTPVLSDPKAYYPLFQSGYNENLRLPEGRTQNGFVTWRQPGKMARAVFEVQSPYVIIDGNFSVDLALAQLDQSLLVETSIDGGRNWQSAGKWNGPFQGRCSGAPAVLSRSEHGTLTAVSGHYAYLLRFTFQGSGSVEPVRLSNIVINTRFQLNPRSLPKLNSGRNELVYRSGTAERWRAIPVGLEALNDFAFRQSGVRYTASESQGFLESLQGRTAEVIFEISAPGDSALKAFEAGGRFLDLNGGLAPDKFTAEVRRIARAHPLTDPAGATSLSWSLSPGGPFKILWQYRAGWNGMDGERVDRALRWPEVDRRILELPSGTRHVYVRYRFRAMALDNIRLSAVNVEKDASPALEITHVWSREGRPQYHREAVDRPWHARTYTVDTGEGPLENEAIIFYCPRPDEKR